MPPSNRAKAITYLLLMAVYGVAYNVLWAIWLKDKVAIWPKPIATIFPFVALLLPLILLLSAAGHYSNKGRGDGQNSSPTNEYAKLWRGEQSLGKSLGFTFISTFLLIATTVRLVYLTSHPSAMRSALLFSVALALFVGLHVVTTRGTWRSAKQYSGAKTWAWLAQSAVIASYVATLFLFAWLAGHSYVD
jgi:hypothetical protein